MTKLIVAFVSIAIALGLVTIIIAATYDSVALPVASESGAATPVPTPDEIANLVLWLDADDSSTISIGVGVSQWNDKSGQGNHVTQGTGTLQPTVTSSAINGKDAITFDGTDDYMQRTTYTGGDITHDYTYFMVLAPDPVTVGYQVYMDGAHSANRGQIAQLTTTGELYMYSGGTRLDTGDIRTTDWQVIEAVFDTTSSEFFRDRVSLIDGTTTSADSQGVTLASRFDGSTSFASNISVATVLVYDRELTTAERNDIYDYIETQYDLGLTITGDYSEEVQVVNNPWADTQTALSSNAQSAIGLLVVVVFIIAVVIIISYLRRMN